MEAIDVFEVGHLTLPPRLPRMRPDQFGFDGFEEYLNGRVVMAVALAAQQFLEAILVQYFLIIVRAVLASTIPVEDATFGQCSERNGPVQRPDRKAAFHPVADSPADHTP